MPKKICEHATRPSRQYRRRNGSLILSAVLVSTAAFSRPAKADPVPACFAPAVSLWKGEFDAVDSVGPNSGAIRPAWPGNVPFGDGHQGHGFDFRPGGSLEAPNSNSLEPQTVTLTAWVRNQDQPEPAQYVAAKGGYGCQGSSYALYTGRSGGLAFYVLSDGFVISPESDVGIWDGQWHHVAGSYDGSYVRLYVDGVELGSGTWSAEPAIHYQLADSNDFSVGAYHGGCVRGAAGEIDQVTLYAEALSSGQIRADYLATR